MGTQKSAYVWKINERSEEDKSCVYRQIYLQTLLMRKTRFNMLWTERIYGDDDLPLIREG